jgi:hemolysin activation/secretion protein
MRFIGGSSGAATVGAVKTHARTPVGSRRCSDVARWVVAAVALACSAAALGQAAAPAREPEDVAATRFDILEFAIEGNSVLRPLEIEGAVLPYLGPARRMADVEAARTALEKLYQDRGFLTVLVDVPEQRIDDGVVRLAVTEGRIEKLAVVGSRYFSQGYIREKVPELQEGRVPNFNQVQTELAAVNRTAERRVQPVLRPGIEPGTVQVDLKVDDQLPLAANLELNNLHAPDTESWRLIAGLRYDNLWQRDHSLALNLITSPEDTSQTRVISANYSVPMDGGATWLLYAVDSQSNVVSLGGTSVIGNGLTIGTRYIWPIANSAAGFHTLSAGADYKDLEEDVRFGNDTIRTPLRYLPFQFGYSGNWFGEGRNTTLTATLTAAARSILERKIDCPGNVGPVDQFGCKRRGADGSFAWLRLDARHSERFSLGTLALRFALQGANEPLASAEQFQLGGADTVRGYLEGVSAGDHGALASIEFRSPNAAPMLQQRFGGGEAGGSASWLSDLTLLGFLEAGQVNLVDALPGQPSKERLGSYGVGLRASGRPGWQLSLDVAAPQTRPLNARSQATRTHLRFGLRL